MIGELVDERLLQIAYTDRPHYKKLNEAKEETILQMMHRKSLHRA